MATRLASRGFQLRVLGVACAVAVLGVSVGAQVAWAPAPIPAIHNTALVLAKLDDTQSPTYPDEGFIDRNGLSVKVQEVLDVMTGPSTKDDYCPPMQEIVDRSLEFVLPGSPAQELFLRDWSRVRILADCEEASSNPPGR